MKTGLIVPPRRLKKLHQPRKSALLIHLEQGTFIAAAVEEQKRRDQKERLGVVLLQQSVNNLPPHIIRIRDEDIRQKQLEQTSRDIIFGAKVFIYSFPFVS